MKKNKMIGFKLKRPYAGPFKIGKPAGILFLAGAAALGKTALGRILLMALSFAAFLSWGGLLYAGGLPPYGYLVSEADLYKVPAGSFPSGGGALASGKSGTLEGSYKKEAAALFGHGLRRAVRARPKTFESAYLAVPGGVGPGEAPLVYYKFTKRSMGRHGGVPLVSEYHRAEVVKDETGLWRADMKANSYGTLELYSRYELEGSVVYSQLNILRSMRDGGADFSMPESLKGIPEGWPEFVFPVSKANGMPFRGARTETPVDF